MALRAPDVIGPRGRGWKIATPAGAPPDHAASLEAWLVNCPGYHAMWAWWSIGVVHLRDLPGVPPANKKYPEAEYQFMIWALDPTKGEPDPDHPENGYPFMIPADVIEQFHGVTDEQAAAIGMMAASIVVRGLASPDQDWREWWKRAIRSSVEHAQLGGHVNGPSGAKA